MADHFVGAVKEHTARLKQQQEAPAETIMPAVVQLVKQSNLELVRWMRNNPQMLVKTS
jgi:hypothetical protein